METNLQPAEPHTGTASEPTVLLLDDDANTLLVLHSVLERTRVRVIECEDEKCATNWCRELSENIDLLVADVVLKGSTGPSVVQKVKPMQPSMRLLFISGFSLNDLSKRGLLRDDDLTPGRAEFLQKPFTPAAFLERVNGLLLS